METSTLFPRRLEKHKFLLRSIEGVAFRTRDIGNYPCLTEASTTDHYLTTRLQYSVVKIFKNLYKLVVRRLQVHEIHPAYELTQLYLLDGSLKYFERSAAIKTLCNYITDHLELLLEHILNTDPNEMWQKGSKVWCMKYSRINCMHVRGVERNTCTVHILYTALLFQAR